MTDGQSTTSSTAEVEGYVHSPQHQQQHPPHTSSYQQREEQREDQSADGSHIDDDAPFLPQFFPHSNDVSSVAHHHGVAAGDKSTRWSARDDVVLCDALIAQNEKGRSRNIAVVFSLDAWEEVAEALKGSELISGGAVKTVAQCKARWQRLKTEFRIVKHLRYQPGFGWDEATQMVTASSAAWDAYVATHRDAQPWRKKSFPCYSRVAYLIEDDEGHDKGDAKFRRRWEANIGRRASSPGTRAAVRKAFKEAQARAQSQERVQAQTVRGAVPVQNATFATVQIQNDRQNAISAPSSAASTLVPASVSDIGGSTSVFPIIRSEHNGTKFVNRFAPVPGGPVTTTVTTTAPSVAPATINNALQQLRIASQPQPNGKRPHSPVGEQHVSKRAKTQASAGVYNRPIAPAQAPTTPTYTQHAAPPPPQHTYTPGTIIYTTQAPPPGHVQAPIPVSSNANYVAIPPPSSSSSTPQPYPPATVHVHQIPVPSPNALPPTHTGPTRLAEAIQTLESTYNEDGFSEAQFIKAVQIFERRSEAADAYLAIRSRRARVLFLRAELEEFRKSNDRESGDPDGAAAAASAES
ncbi:hypothetical protein A7U60_g316 [Sanghuangporus baumii]|uniref:Myb-like domain-containing protein n=1 Tax=Sanghuangporus baumii TaxID=108892 RepID=A0A9Q5I662_SANBA|nr:hypothetical protein A7U60_g316 [Sanghuangporus baumii]